MVAKHVGVVHIIFNKSCEEWIVIVEILISRSVDRSISSKTQGTVNILVASTWSIFHVVVGVELIRDVTGSAAIRLMTLFRVIRVLTSLRMITPLRLIAPL